MDGFPGQTTKKMMQQQSISARRHELEKRIDELFRAMAVEIATLFVEQGHELEHTHLKPYYAELREIHNEIRNLLLPSYTSSKFPQHLLQQQLPIPELPERLQNTSFQNQTFTSTIQQEYKPRSLKIKIRVLDKTSQQEQKTVGIYSHDELVSSLRNSNEAFTDSSEHAIVSPVVEEGTPLLIIKPAKRFL